jgi:hypothetical protein
MLHTLQMFAPYSSFIAIFCSSSSYCFSGSSQGEWGLSVWPSELGRAPSCFIAHEFDGSRVQTPGADTVNQAVHPSGIGKLLAVSMQRKTAVEDCEVKRAAVRWLACGLCGRMAQTTTCWFPAVRMDDLGSSVSCLGAK